ncbi:MAG TPA: hypothetical protein VEI83_03310 [Acidimicrobiales bacterium]|nr:hypothetical protein [Acidimicrobiales bacterium]
MSSPVAPSRVGSTVTGPAIMSRREQRRRRSQRHLLMAVGLLALAALLLVAVLVLDHGAPGRGPTTGVIAHVTASPRR